MARQRLLAERKLPTTDNKDEIPFGNQSKKSPIVLNGSGIQMAGMDVFQACWGGLNALGTAWRKACERGGRAAPVRTIGCVGAERPNMRAIFSNHFAGSQTEQMSVCRRQSVQYRMLARSICTISSPIICRYIAFVQAIVLTKVSLCVLYRNYKGFPIEHKPNSFCLTPLHVPDRRKEGE
ncbi:hypothetical protein, partial [Pseudomonas amygdali]